MRRKKSDGKRLSQKRSDVAIGILGVIFMVTATYLDTTVANALEPTGASVAWTSQEDALVRARQLLKEGEFTKAEAELKATPIESPAQGEMLEMIGRLRREYSMGADDLATRLQGPLPGVTITDIERWRATGGIQWRKIDGKPAIFRREPANLFRFCEEAKQRRGAPVEPPNTGWSLGPHLQEILAEADRTGMEHVLPIRHRVTHTLTVPANAPGTKVGAVVRVWLPFPQEHERQRDVHLIASSPHGGLVAPPDSPQRSIYFELSVVDPAKPLAFSETVEFTSLAYYPKLDDARALPLSADFAGGNIGERPPHIVFTPPLRKAVAEAVGDATNPLTRARRIYQWVVGHIAYCAEEEYGVIPSLAEKALETRRGDCGVQSVLFITMCRCAGIPARWQSGWETKPGDVDMHDWAEFYVDPWGWLPADPSYGLQKSDAARIREFYFGHQDSYRLIVNRDFGSPLHPVRHSLRSDPVDFQRGEVEIDGHNLYFNDWSHDVKFDRK